MAVHCRISIPVFFLLIGLGLNGCTLYQSPGRSQQRPFQTHPTNTDALTRAGLAVRTPALSNETGNESVPPVIERLYNQTNALVEPAAVSTSPSIRIHRVGPERNIPPHPTQTNAPDRSPPSATVSLDLDSTATPTPDGLEASARWTSPLWGDPLDVSQSSAQHTGLDGKVLRIHLREDTPDKDKGVAQLSLAPAISVSTKSTLELICFTPNGRQPVRIAAAVSVGTDYTYYESQPVLVKPGRATNLRIPLGTESWKTDATNWRYETSVPAGSSVRQLMLLIYNADPSLELLVDAIQIHPLQQP